MKYPPLFALQVKRVYPEEEMILDALAEGAERLGFALEVLAVASWMDTERIIESFSHGSILDIEAAKKSLRRTALHTEWLKLYQAQHICSCHHCP